MNDDIAEASNRLSVMLLGISAAIVALMFLGAGYIWLVDYLAGHVHL